MSLFDPTSWEWWQRIRSSFLPSEEESRPLGDPIVSPLLRDLDLMEPTDLAAFHHDEHWGQIFDPLDSDGHSPSVDEPTGSERCRHRGHPSAFGLGSASTRAMPASARR